MRVSFTRKQLQAVAKTISKDPTRNPAIQGIKVEHDKLVSTDGHRLTIVQLQSEGGGQHFLVSSNEVERMVRMGTKDSKYILDQDADLARLIIDDRDCGKIPVQTDVEFPNYQALIPKDQAKIEIVFNAKYLKGICEQIIANSERRTPTVVLAIRDPLTVVVALPKDKDAPYYLLMPMRP